MDLESSESNKDDPAATDGEGRLTPSRSPAAAA